MLRQSSTPYWGSSFRSLTSAAAFSVVLASVGPAMAFIKMPMMLDAVTAAEGYPVERHYYISPATPGYHISGWNSAALSNSQTVAKRHRGNTPNYSKE
jgi:hypothetical protein